MVRTKSSASSGNTTPQHSPTEKHHYTERHHHRHGSGKKATGDSHRKARPTSLYRRNTPQYLSTTSINKLGSGKRESKEEEDRGLAGESFPQFCTFCEKQITSSSSNYLYCSESCRRRDLQASSTHSRNASISNSPTSPSFSPTTITYTRSISSIYPSDGPDIVPRASPTIYQRSSYYNADPFTSTESIYSVSSASTAKPSQYSTSNRPATMTHTSSSALASLRELSAALDIPSDQHARRNSRKSSKAGSSTSGADDAGNDDSPSEEASAPSSPSANISRSSSGIWNYMAFTSASAATAMKNVASHARGDSHARGSGDVSRSYHHPERSYTAPQLPTLGSTYVGSTYGPGSEYRGGGEAGMGMDRRRIVPPASTYMVPLPPRVNPGGVAGHRGGGVDLVTPYGGI